MSLIARFPFLALGCAGLLFFGAWLAAGAPARDTPGGALLYWPHWLLLWPWRQVATYVDVWFRALPEWVDVLGTLFLGLVPYLVADAVIAIVRRFRRRRASTSAASSR